MFSTTKPKEREDKGTNNKKRFHSLLPNIFQHLCNSLSPSIFGENINDPTVISDTWTINDVNTVHFIGKISAVAVTGFQHSHSLLPTVQTEDVLPHLLNMVKILNGPLIDCRVLILGRIYSRGRSQNGREEFSDWSLVFLARD